MAILQKLKSLLGFEDSSSERGDDRDVGVTVEREGSQQDTDQSGKTDITPAPSSVSDDRDDADADRDTEAETPSAESEPAAAAGSTEPETPEEPIESAPTGDEPSMDDAEAIGEGDESDAEVVTEAEPETEAEADAEAESDAEPDAEAESEPDTDVEPEPDVEPESDAELDTDAEADAEVEAEPDTEDETETEPETETKDDSEPVDVIKGIGPAYADRLGAAGIETVDDLAAADAADLGAETDISETRIQGWIDKARVR